MLKSNKINVKVEKNKIICYNKKENEGGGVIKMKKKTIIKIIFIALCLICLINYNVKATFNPDDYNVPKVNKTDADTLFTMGEKAMGTIQNIAVIVAVITVAVIGLRYMFGSVDQKAEYKATMLPWLIGAIVVFSITGIIDIIQNLASSI